MEGNVEWCGFSTIPVANPYTVYAFGNSWHVDELEHYPQLTSLGGWHGTVARLKLSQKGSWLVVVCLATSYFLQFHSCLLELKQSKHTLTLKRIERLTPAFSVLSVKMQQVSVLFYGQMACTKSLWTTSTTFYPVLCNHVIWMFTVSHCEGQEMCIFKNRLIQWDESHGNVLVFF